MKLGYKISLFVIGILLAISTSIGSSYALWTITESQENPNEITSGCFSLSYVDEIDGKSTNIYLKTYLVNKTENVNFEIKNLNNLDNVTLDDNLIETLSTENMISISNTYLLSNGVLNPDEEVQYELRLWLDENAPNETMNSKFTAVVSNIAYATESK